MSMSSTVFTTTAASVPFGERIVINSEQVVTVSTTNGIDQDNNNTIHRNTSSLVITQSAEDGTGVLECEGDLMCDIWCNNTLAASNAGKNTTNTTMITSALDTLNQMLNQRLNQSLNQSSIPPLLFGDNDTDMLNNSSDIFNEQEDLDAEMDEWIDRMLNETLGDLQAPLQTPPDLLPVSI